VRVARGVTVSATGELWAVGEEDGPAGTRAWAQQLSSEGEVLDEVVFDTLADDRFTDATSAIAPFAGGETDGRAWLRSLADDGREHLVPALGVAAMAGRDDGTLAALLVADDAPVELHVFAPGGAVIAATPLWALASADAIALARDGSVLLAGAELGDRVLVRSDFAGELAWSSVLPEDVVIAAVLELDDGDIALAGTFGESAAKRPWIARFDPEGAVRWQRTLDDASDTTVVGAARREDGSLVVAGWRGAFPRVWIAAIAP
jgi:hypothetical protein